MIALFHLLDDVDDVLDATIVGTGWWAAVAGADLGWVEGFTVDGGLDTIVGLHVEWGPTEVAGGDETGIDNGCDLEGEDRYCQGSAQDGHWEHFIHFSLKIRIPAPIRNSASMEITANMRRFIVAVVMAGLSGMAIGSDTKPAAHGAEAKPAAAAKPAEAKHGEAKPAEAKPSPAPKPVEHAAPVKPVVKAARPVVRQAAKPKPVIRTHSSINVSGDEHVKPSAAPIVIGGSATWIND